MPTDMCTVSIVPSCDGWRLVCNRDERTTRPDALAPVVRRVDRRLAMFPLDPAGGGTWIGTNDAGLACALLNRTIVGGSGSGSRRSRGAIIPPLLACDALDEAVGRAMRVDAADFEPFRLIVLQRSRVAVIVSDGRRLSGVIDAIDGPIMFTSSSLGDDIVEGPRRRLFERMMLPVPADQWPDAQRRFHRHRWPALPAISVVMARPDARTVSRTVIDISTRRTSLRYRALPVH